MLYKHKRSSILFEKKKKVTSRNVCTEASINLADRSCEAKQPFIARIMESKVNILLLEEMASRPHIVDKFWSARVENSQVGISVFGNRCISKFCSGCDGPARKM